MKKILILLFPLLFIVLSLNAQAVRIDTLGISNKTFSDTSAARSFDYFAYPYVYFTPETQLAFGAGGMVYFRTTNKEKVRTSKVGLSAYYTTNDQYSINLTPAIYFPGVGKDLLEVKLQYYKEVAKYWGTGPDAPDIDDPDYIMNSFRLYGEFGAEGLLINQLHTGFIIDYSANVMSDKKSNPYLDSGTTPGEDGGDVSGLGLLLILDKRDNLFYPTENMYFKVRAMAFGTNLGSDFTFQRVVADLRHYFSFLESHVLAVQLYGEMTWGEPPFYKLPALGGSSRMRGYFYGRYRDDRYLTAQIEYRKIVWWRLGVAAFAGIGDVAEEFVDMKIGKFKHSYGFGIRFVFDEKEKINLRVDVGFGDNTTGIYFSMEEAF